MLACDCSTGATRRRTTRHALVFLEVGTRRVRLAGGTAPPAAAGVAQQARNRTRTLQEASGAFRYPIQARDAQFPAAFDRVCTIGGLDSVRTPYRAPRRHGWRVYTLTVEPVGDRWYAEARHLGALFAAGSGDAPGEALAFVRAILLGLAGEQAA